MIAPKHPAGVRFPARSLVPALLLVAWPAGAADAIDAPEAQALALNCFTCHGTDGRSPGAMPGINGKSADYLRRKLREFRAGEGDPTIMNRIARGYSDEEIDRIADFLAGLR